MRILFAAAVAAMTLCLSSLNAFSQGAEMRLPTDGGFEINRVFDSNETPRRPVVSGVGSSVKPEPRVLTKGPLAPSAQDRANQASFLKRPNTGLLRLASRQSTFYSQLVKINGGGAYYSFVHKSHEYGYGSDLELSTRYVNVSGTWLHSYHQLSVGFAGAAFGMMTNLGETPLETLDLKDPRAEFLFTYRAPRKESEARHEQTRFRKGISIDGHIYQSRLVSQVGATYLLRSIDYDRSDVLVAFRVVRQDTDQSLIIAWQLLKRFSTPRLDRSK